MINFLKKISKHPAKKLYIWGAGPLGRSIADALTLVGVRIDGYFDNAFPDGREDGEKIHPISYLEKQDLENTYFIVGSYREKEIIAQLREEGFTNIYCQCELAMYYHEEFPKISFEKCDEPEVSVLVTAYNGWNMTYNTLKSLSENENQCKFEVIVGDNCSTDLTKHAEEYLENVKVIHHEKNLRYLGNMNAIAKEARGEYLFFCSNDILFTQKRYIDILLAEAKKDARIGMITGKLWVPFKRKYDVHSVYIKLGECEEVELDRPKNVENMWPIATIIPDRVWKEMGGYDTAFLPVYYEDADVEMRMIAAGYELVAYPFAECIHYGGATDKWDNNDPQLLKNRALFNARWEHYIEQEKDKRQTYVNAR
ncbi:MAG: glycosyltransferase [Lachnospiraceae bacterium]